MNGGQSACIFRAVPGPRGRRRHTCHMSAMEGALRPLKKAANCGSGGKRALYVRDSRAALQALGHGTYG